MSVVASKAEFGALSRSAPQKLLHHLQTEPVREVIEKANVALRDGHRVFVVGWFAFPPIYAEEWSRLFAYSLQRHATTMTPLRVEAPTRVNPFEEVSLIVATGWRP